MRKTELLGFLSDLEPSSQAQVWAWFVKHALQLRMPLFFGHFAGDDCLLVGSFPDEWMVANRVSLSRQAEGLTFWYGPGLRLRPKSDSTSSVFRVKLSSSDYRDILQIALLKEVNRG